MEKIQYLRDRLKEPSSQSAICAILFAAGVNVDQELIQAVIYIIGVAIGLLAIKTPDGVKNVSQ
jgi:hypothetical protein